MSGLPAGPDYPAGGEREPVVDAARRWAVRGWLEAARILELEFGPYRPERYLTGHHPFYDDCRGRLGVPPDAPGWLREALAAELPEFLRALN